MVIFKINTDKEAFERMNLDKFILAEQDLVATIVGNTYSKKTFEEIVRLLKGELFEGEFEYVTSVGPCQSGIKFSGESYSFIQVEGQYNAFYVIKEA